MAEINIQKKKRVVWPWIVGLLVIGIILIFIVLSLDDRDDFRSERVSDYPDTTEIVMENDYTEENNSAKKIEEFSAFVKDDIENHNGNEEGYTAKGAALLASTLKTIVEEEFPEDVNLDAQSDLLNSTTRYLETKSNDAVLVKKSFTGSAELIAIIEDKKNLKLDNEVQDVKQSAERINTGKKISEQKSEIKTFFNESSGALRAIVYNGSYDNKMKKY